MPVNKSILIIDDDRITLHVLTKAFERNGYKVYTARNGMDGLEAFKKEHADIVLTDIKMPGLSGVELATLIRNESPNTKVAVMSAGDEEIYGNLIKDGTADHFFQKPLAASHVYKTLSSVGHAN